MAQGNRDMQRLLSLRTISGLAKDMKRFLGPSVSQPESTSPSVPIPPLDLRFPTDIQTAIEDSGLPLDVVQKATDRLRETVRALERLYSSNYERACHQLTTVHRPPELQPVSVVINKLRQTFQAIYERQHLPKIREQILAARPTPLVPKNTRDYNKRRVFNNEFVPFLECYFEENAFPSHADKSRFAQKSMMTYRQIDVWFQNRRSRARKDGTPLKKLHASEYPKSSFKRLEKQMAGWIVPMGERVEPVDSDISEYEWQQDSSNEDNRPIMTSRCARQHDISDPFDFEAPPHAFPSAYPPSCAYDPFPTTKGNHSFPRPVWIRQPATSPVGHPPVMNFDDFVSAFDNMDLRETSKKRAKKIQDNTRKLVEAKRTRYFDPKLEYSMAIPFTTKPLPAPLPSLVRPKTLSLVARLPVSVIPSVPATSRRHVFRSPSPQSRSVTLVPPAQSMAVIGRRKIAPLPKRTPTSIARRRDMLASSPLSRTPSLQSDSPKTRTYSDSSSPPSSTVATPISSPLPLREPSFTLDELFGDVPIDARSPVKGLRLDFRPVNNIGKHPFDFSCDTLPPVRVQC